MSAITKMKKYYYDLCLNDEKTEEAMFYLDNHAASRKLNIYIDGDNLKQNFTPTYLGMSLDGTLTYKPALEQRF